MNSDGRSLREELVATAVAMLESETQQLLSLRAVARRCGVSHNAPYHYFSDKDELLAAVASVGFRMLAQIIREEGVTVPGLSRAYIRFAQGSPEMVRLMFGPCDFIAQGALEFEEASRDAFSLLLEGTRAAYPVADEHELIRRAVELWSLLHGFVSLLQGNALSHVPRDAMPTPESMSALFASRFGHSVPSSETSED